MNINVAAFRTPPTKQTDHADQILGTDSESRRVFRNAMLQAIDMVVDQTAAASSLYSGTSFQGLRGLIDDLDPLPEVGTGIAAALAEIGRPALEHAMVVGHPAAMAHLHCPVAVPALAAEVLISATNQSLDSWDQSPFATLVEERVLACLTQLAELPASASGNFTSGGTQSNMTALYLAAVRCGPDARKAGVVLTSAHAHFSIRKSAAILGFAEDAVIAIAADADGRMSVPALKAELLRVAGEGRIPVAVVATAERPTSAPSIRLSRSPIWPRLRTFGCMWMLPMAAGFCFPAIAVALRDWSMPIRSRSIFIRCFFSRSVAASFFCATGRISHRLRARLITLTPKMRSSPMHRISSNVRCRRRAEPTL